MNKLIVIFLLTFCCQSIIAQNIFSALQLNAEMEYKTVRPKRIVETNTFFNSGGNQIEQNIKNFDEAGMLVTEERYDENGKLAVRLTYTNDTVHRITMSRVIERWTNQGYSKKTAIYAYDKNYHLIGIEDRDENGRIITQTRLVCNENGHPIELMLFDGNGNSFGRETGTYLYDINKVVTAVIAIDGRILTSDTLKINFKEASKFPGLNEVYNSHGDVTNWVSRNFNGNETIYEEEYDYDKFGNCIENRVYKVSVKGKGKRKREKDRIFKKEYVY